MDVGKAVGGLESAKARKIIRQNQNRPVLIIKSNGDYAYGKVDSRDPEDRKGGYLLITLPRNLITRHQYSDTRKIFSLDESSQLL